MLLEKLTKDRNIKQLNFKLEKSNHICSGVKVVKFIWHLWNFRLENSRSRFHEIHFSWKEEYFQLYPSVNMYTNPQIHVCIHAPISPPRKWQDGICAEKDVLSVSRWWATAEPGCGEDSCLQLRAASGEPKERSSQRGPYCYLTGWQSQVFLHNGKTSWKIGNDN